MSGGRAWHLRTVVCLLTLAAAGWAVGTTLGLVTQR